MPRERVNLESKVAFLRDPRHYSERSRRVVAVETHFAWVFLTERFAYKLKKPARQSGMDYRTLAARERGCRSELELNRRLAPRVYLSVVPLTWEAGSLSLGGSGRVVDWLVKMKRLPARAMLERHLEGASLRSADLGPVARLLARFYQRAESTPIGPREYLSRLALQIRVNRDALRKLPGLIDMGLVGGVADAQLDFLLRARRLLGARGARVVEAHGDLRAEHVCLKPLAVIDCLEFDRELRLLDPMEDLALLALEIERSGHPAGAAYLLQRVGALTGDFVARSIIHFYMSHRAATRAKLAAWHVGDPQFRDSAPWLACADSYLHASLDHAGRAIRELAAGSHAGSRRDAMQCAAQFTRQS